MIRVAKWILLILFCGCYVSLMGILAHRARKVQIRINWRDQMDRLLEASGGKLKKNQQRYEKKKVYLSQIGAAYLIGRTVLPEEYLLFQISLAILFGMLGGSCFGGIGLLGSVVGFFAPTVLLNVLNDRDNKRILRDIKGIYDTILIKTQGGMFLTSAIMECYKHTRNRRLKRALYEMTGQIIARCDLLETIDAFRLKFRNQYIDNLCIILKQSLDSGKTVEILQSIQDQLSDMQNAVNLQMRNRLNAKVMMVQMLLYLTIVIFCVGAAFVAIGSDFRF